MLSITDFEVGEVLSKFFVLLIHNCTQRDEMRRLHTAKEELESMKYHPLRKNEHNVKRKKLKSCHSCESNVNSSIFSKKSIIVAYLHSMTLFLS
jgi:hypothetical protein